MPPIKKAIYSLPEIRHSLRPLWSAWVLVGVGAVCMAVAVAVPVGEVLASALWGMAAVGGLCLLMVLCFWAFGDSRRPYSRPLRARLDPTFAYYAPAQRERLLEALLGRDERALDAVRRTPGGSLVLVRYSDAAERVFYSQLQEGGKPLTDIIINEKH